MEIKVICVIVCAFGVPVSTGSCPDVCICRNSVADCSRRGLVSLPSGLDLSTQDLSLAHNYIDRIPDELHTLKNLTKLNLSYNKISLIDYGDLAGITTIKYLDLSFNMLHDSRDIKFSEFNQLQLLEELNLSNNAMKKFIPFFSQKLKKLLINNCSLITLNIKTLLENTPNLKELNVSRNPLGNLSECESSTLEILDVSDCNLKIVHQPTFLNLTALQYLYIRRNRNLKKFHASAPTIKTLDLSNCNLESVPDGNLKEVVIANFHGNNFRRLNQYVFSNFAAIEQLDLSYNVIISVEQNAFYGLNQLKEINLSYNTLTSIENKMFSDNKKLKKLKLSHNYFTRMVQLESDSLTYLDLSVCEISTIHSNSLIDMTNLQFLNLSRNLISVLPDNLEAYNLYKLDVSLCHITLVNNRTFSRMTSLRSLNLSGNRLTYINPNCFPQVFYLEINDNPWRCECKSLQSIHEWFQNSGQPTNNLICQSPEKFQGMAWDEACENEWYNVTKKDTLWWYSVAVIVTMLLVLSSIIVVRRIFNLREKRIREAEAARRAEERESLRRMRRIQQESREEANRNAPDPRELQRPPSYHEALLLPRLDASHPSLAGSLHSVASRQSNSETSGKKARVRRKRRRKSETESRRASREIADTGSSSENDRQVQPPPLQSDF